MQLEIDLAGRSVVVVGSSQAARRVVRRYRAAGAEVTALPVRPVDRDELAGVLLVCLVGLPGRVEASVRAAAAERGIPVAVEPAAEPGGRVTLVGGGPGSVDLLTAAAARALREADVVFFDRLAPHDELTRLAPGAELVDVGKHPYHHPVGQRSIEDQLIERAREGLSVVRLKGGDPYVFGRGGEEVLACRAAGVPVDVVPGVTSAVAVPAAAGIPITHRGVAHEFVVVSGHVAPDDPRSLADWPMLAKLRGTLCVLMGLGHLPAIVDTLIEHGRASDTPCAAIQEGTTGAQRVVRAPLADIADLVAIERIRPPAIVVIGSVVDALS